MVASRTRAGVGAQFVRAYTPKTSDWRREAPGSPIPMIAATPGVKRDGLSLRGDRWRVDNFHRAGGPLLWQHDHARPSLGNGRATPDARRLQVNMAFDQEDPFAVTIESKLRRGFLNSSSVGWDFVNDAGETIQHSRHFANSLAREAWYDLSEVSVVNVPADPQAVAERHWRALRSVSPEFARLYQDQERRDSDSTAEQIREAVVDLCNRMGIEFTLTRAAAGKVAKGKVDDESDGGLAVNWDDDEDEDDDEDLDEDEDPDEDPDDGDDDSEEDDDEVPAKGKPRGRSAVSVIRGEELRTLLRSHGVALAEIAPLVPEPIKPTVDQRAAKAVIAAFTPVH